MQHEDGRSSDDRSTRVGRLGEDGRVQDEGEVDLGIPDRCESCSQARACIQLTRLDDPKTMMFVCEGCLEPSFVMWRWQQTT